MWQEKLQALKKETYAIYLAAKHPQVPWYAKLLATCIVAYAVSPIDLIPDFIPIIGYLDDLILLPLGILLVVKMIPKDILDECRREAETAIAQNPQAGKFAAIAIVVIWIIMGFLAAIWLSKLWKG
jgi:uncharacterized membrane protein YkvA (DUF1232 family)